MTRFLHRNSSSDMSEDLQYVKKHGSHFFRVLTRILLFLSGDCDALEENRCFMLKTPFRPHMDFTNLSIWASHFLELQFFIARQLSMSCQWVHLTKNILK